MQEVIAWAKGNIELLLIALPVEIRNIPLGIIDGYKFLYHLK